MKVSTLLKIAAVAFTAGVSWGAASLAAKQELAAKLDATRFERDSVRTLNNYEKAMWEIRSELKYISDLTADNTNRLREICLQLKTGCR